MNPVNMNQASPNEPNLSAHPPSGALRASSGQALALMLSWAAVGLPLAWGVAETLRKALVLFR